MAVWNVTTTINAGARPSYKLDLVPQSASYRVWTFDNAGTPIKYNLATCFTSTTNTVNNADTRWITLLLPPSPSVDARPAAPTPPQLSAGMTALARLQNTQKHSLAQAFRRPAVASCRANSIRCPGTSRKLPRSPRDAEANSAAGSLTRLARLNERVRPGPSALQQGPASLGERDRPQQVAPYSVRVDRTSESWA